MSSDNGIISRPKRHSYGPGSTKTVSLLWPAKIHNFAVSTIQNAWDRARALDFFGFDYRLECYTPQAKRRYGYFVLPILCRGELIGRLDAKAHRQDGVLEVKLLHAEPGSPWQDAQVEDVAQCVARFAHWQGLTRVTLAQTQPKRLAAALRSVLQTQEEP